MTMSQQTGQRNRKVATKHVTDKLDALEADLAHMKEQIRQSQRMAALGTTAAMLAHEVNNMMTPILGYGKYALGKRDPEIMAKALQTTLEQADTLIAMADRVLNMAVSGPVDVQPVQVVDIVDSAVRCLCRDLSKDGVALETSIPNDLRVQVDARQMQQVFFNLILNARDAVLSHKKGTITINARPINNHRVEVTVSDTGCGIAPEHIEKVFDTFFSTKGQNGSNGTRQRGTGLGLSVCRDIVHEHQGMIGVASQPNEGTTFTITLPAAR